MSLADPPKLFNGLNYTVFTLGGSYNQSPDLHKAKNILKESILEVLARHGADRSFNPMKEDPRGVDPIRIFVHKLIRVSHFFIFKLNHRGKLEFTKNW